MNVSRFLGELRRRGIELRADGDNLRVSAPKGAVTAEVAAEIRASKADVLAFLRMGQQDASAERETIARAELEPDERGVIEAPLSFGQRRLFYLDQLAPGQPTYNVPVARWLSGPLDVGRLERAINAVVARHAALRTTLHLTPKGPRQRIVPELSVALPCRDIEEAALAEALASEAQKPFDLSAGPLIRAQLYRLAPERHVLLIVTHHVISDGHSGDVFEHDLLASYRGEALPPLPIRYADFAIWQLGTVDDDEYQRELAFWREALVPPLPVLDLPTTYPRPASAATDGAVCSIELEPRLVNELTARGRREGATLFMVLLAAYATLLHRLSGQDRVIIGTPVAARTSEEVEHLIGYIANTLPLSIDLTEDPTFSELLGRVRDLCVGAYANQHFPFDALVELVEVERDVTRTPIFQTIFAFEDAHAQARPDSGDGLVVSHSDTVHAGSARTDLSVWVSRSPDGLNITAEYPTLLFDADAVETMLMRFRRILDAVARGGSESIGHLAILSDEELAQQRAWDGPELSLPSASGVHELIADRAARVPDRIAVSDETTSLTYAELDRRAAQFAAVLDVEPDQRVGLRIGRSVNMVVALLGIWKAGATYVPLDPDFPEERLSFMVEDAGLDLIVDDATVEASHDATPAEPRPAARVAYVIYTSGSTGKPKGVLVPHETVIAFLTAMAKEPGLGEDDVLVAVTTLSFDIAVLELYLPLFVGARVVIASKESASDGTKLLALLRESGATALQATPTTWRLLVAAGWDGSPLRKVLCGGEALPSDLAKQLAERVGEVWNMYGPTETTVWSTCYRLPEGGAPVLIGRPIANTQIAIVDAGAERVPVGVAGELWIGGAGVTDGYLDRPALTADRFVDGFYRTGDLARYRPDGQIEFLGRMDNQVKVRGFRIELGEIETVIAAHPEVTAAAVVVVDRGAGDTRLTGFYIADREIPSAELQQHARQLLPDYMVPGQLARLDAFPLTPNKKVDKKALATLEAPREVRSGGIGPRNDAERLLAERFASLIGIDDVKVGDNFFELGGHSLLAMELIASVEAETGLRLTASEVLLDPLEQLAQRLPGQAGDESQELIAPSQAQRRLIRFGAQEELCGVFHEPQGPARGEAVVLCPPLFQEYMRTHWALRKVAATLTGAGFSVMRFDYYATGDSLGDTRSGAVERWVSDVATAVRHARALGACERVSVVGLRFGAALAALAGQGDASIDRLVMWDPVIVGNAYLDELSRLHEELMYDDMRYSLAEAARRRLLRRLGRGDRLHDGETLIGFPVPRALRAEIASVDLRERPLGRCTIVRTGEIVGAQRIEAVDHPIADPGDWADPKLIETALLPVKALGAIRDILEDR